MKKTLFLAAICLIFAQFAIAQRAQIGVLGGANGNATHFSKNIGLDFNYRIWRGLYWMGRTEYQQHSFDISKIPTLTPESVQFKHKDLMSYQTGLGWRYKGFYATTGVAYLDNLNGGEYNNLIFPSDILIDIYCPECPKRELMQRYKNPWQYFVNFGYSRQLTPKSKVLLEVQYARQMFDHAFYHMSDFNMKGFRVGASRVIK
jgi:hypothetical protein